MSAAERPSIVRKASLAPKSVPSWAMVNMPTRLASISRRNCCRVTASAAWALAHFVERAFGFALRVFRLAGADARPSGERHGRDRRKGKPVPPSIRKAASQNIESPAAPTVVVSCGAISAGPTAALRAQCQQADTAPPHQAAIRR